MLLSKNLDVPFACAVLAMIVALAVLAVGLASLLGTGSARPRPRPGRAAPGWRPKDLEAAGEFERLNEREWSEEERQRAREHGILTSGVGLWSHEKLQKAKQLQLI